MKNEIIDKIILDALKEDMPEGDITTDTLIKDGHQSKARFIAKEDGVFSGIDVLNRVFELVGGSFELEIRVSDGDFVKKSDILAIISGDTKTILKGERVTLNLIQRMSGIATMTHHFVNQIQGDCKLLDTRKTTPNLRYLEKLAVTHGGGVNHRYSLSDMVMIKDNHIRACGSITEAVRQVYGKVDCKIEVEVETLDEFMEALATPCHIIMLDNMSLEMMRECVRLNQGKKKLEASGNMTLERVREVSETGVDFISVGALTHSVKSLDISLKFEL